MNTTMRIFMTFFTYSTDKSNVGSVTLILSYDDCEYIVREYNTEHTEKIRLWLYTNVD